MAQAYKTAAIIDPRQIVCRIGFMIYRAENRFRSAGSFSECAHLKGEKFMADTSSGNRVSIMQLILIPSVISLAITLVRLIGELQNWPSALFNREPGGAGSIIGITWLAPIFGIYFALKLTGAGEGPADRWRAVRMAIFGLVLMFGGLVAIFPKFSFPGKEAVALLLIVAAIACQYAAWPKLFKTLLAYAYAARIPVAILMYFAIRGNWGTHYDLVRPDFPVSESFWPRYFQIAFLPQMLLWIAFTIITGSLCGSIATAIAHRRKPEARAANA
jgi:hypothetical protein